ncbi:MAG: prepilin-type N-terminal cleavage/methylation domain-containing protein [bacterium]
MRRTGFTLIELLIVVAIIAILAAIAVPNFLVAQTRAKLSRAYSDIRSITIALDSYRVDEKDYPPDNGTNGVPSIRQFTGFWNLAVITTPISYISQLPPDPFMPANYPIIWGLAGYRSFHYGHKSSFPPDSTYMYFVASLGPGMKWSGYPYDPTNGTTSVGPIYVWGPGNTRKTGF